MLDGHLENRCHADIVGYPQLFVNLCMTLGGIFVNKSKIGYSIIASAIVWGT